MKIDTVVIRGVNDDELVPLLEFSRSRHAEVRFIEYMDVAARPAGRRTRSSRARRCCRASPQVYGAVEPARQATRGRRPNGSGWTDGTFGIIPSTTAAVLRDLRSEPADRGRLVADVPLRAGGTICGALLWGGRRPRIADRVPTCGRSGRIVARRNGRLTRPAAFDSGRRPQPRRPPGNAHPRRVTTRRKTALGRLKQPNRKPITSRL